MREDAHGLQVADRRSRLLRTLALGALLVAVGCAAIYQKRREALMTRAVFELACEGPQISVTPLDVPSDTALESASVVGVSGCGQRAVYVFDPRRGIWHR